MYDKLIRVWELTGESLPKPSSKLTLRKALLRLKEVTVLSKDIWKNSRKYVKLQYEVAARITDSRKTRKYLPENNHRQYEITPISTSCGKTAR
jgi:hypothetical protein